MYVCLSSVLFFIGDHLAAILAPDSTAVLSDIVADIWVSILQMILIALLFLMNSVDRFVSNL